MLFVHLGSGSLSGAAATPALQRRRSTVLVSRSHVSLFRIGQITSPSAGSASTLAIHLSLFILQCLFSLLFVDTVTLHRHLLRSSFLTSSSIRPSKHSTTHIDVELPHRRHHHHDTTVHIEGPQRRRYEGTQIDVAEREYRSRFQPSYREETRFEATVDPPSFQPQQYREEVRVSGTTVDPPHFSGPQREQVRFTEETVDPPRFQAQRSHVHVSEETVDPPRFSRKSNKMGYYDEDGKSISMSSPSLT